MCISFVDLSQITKGSNASWVWNVGDGSQATHSQSFDHCYIDDSVFAPIPFDITLAVTSDSGCVSLGEKNHYITVYPNPMANFTTDPKTTTVIDPVIAFKNTSSGADFWNWNFGDTDTAMSQNPKPHTYAADTGTYTVRLITSTQYGCLDTAYQTIIIGPDFTFYVPNAFSPNGDGINDYFFGSGIGIVKLDMWIFDRWGNMIFRGKSLDEKWDGKANDGDKGAQIDVYIWKVQLVDVFSIVNGP